MFSKIDKRRLSLFICSLMIPALIACSSNFLLHKPVASFSRNRIICFSPNKVELDSMLATNNFEIDEILSDFFYHTKKAFKALDTFLKEYRINVEYTSNPILRIEQSGRTLSVARQDLEEPLGVILSDGIKLQKILGVAISDSYVEEVRKFFKDDAKTKHL